VVELIFHIGRVMVQSFKIEKEGYFASKILKTFTHLRGEEEGERDENDYCSTRGDN